MVKSSAHSTEARFQAILRPTGDEMEESTVIDPELNTHSSSKRLKKEQEPNEHDQGKVYQPKAIDYCSNLMFHNVLEIIMTSESTTKHVTEPESDDEFGDETLAVSAVDKKGSYTAIYHGTDGISP